jgi:hypothetical protein
MLDDDLWVHRASVFGWQFCGHRGGRPGWSSTNSSDQHAAKGDSDYQYCARDKGAFHLESPSFF